MPVENGFVPTPPAIADYAAAVAFGVTRPSERPDGGRLLLPGLGTGRLYNATRRYCTEGENWYVPRFDYPMPECIGVESDPERIREFRALHPDAEIEIVEADFLTDPPEGKFDWVLANPPFSRYKNIPKEMREVYREAFDVATGQFPLHTLFLEQSLRLLKDGGSLAFILPMSVLTALSLADVRAWLGQNELGPIYYLPTQSFEEKVETVLLGLIKNSQETHHLWLEDLYGYELEPLLEQLGVDDVEAGIRDYREEFRSQHRVVNSRANLQQALQGVNDGPEESHQANEGGGQAQLTAYTDGGDPA